MLLRDATAKDFDFAQARPFRRAGERSLQLPRPAPEADSSPTFDMLRPRLPAGRLAEAAPAPAGTPRYQHEASMNAGLPRGDFAF